MTISFNKKSLFLFLMCIPTRKYRVPIYGEKCEWRVADITKRSSESPVYTYFGQDNFGVRW